MNSIEELSYYFGVGQEKETSKLFENERCPEDNNLLNKFQKDVDMKKYFIEIITKKGFLTEDISDFKIAEIGGGVCSTGAAFAQKCDAVISFELEKVHCLYAKRCKEYFHIHNLGIFYGSIIDVENNMVFCVRDNSADLVVSHMGMFRFTVLDTLEKVSSILKHNGKFICIYPRFWTDHSRLNTIDEELQNRAVKKNSNWEKFKSEFEMKIRELELKLEYNDILEGYCTIPIGGDVILGSNIASSSNEYFENPIKGITFGKTLITCNTLICSK